MTPSSLESRRTMPPMAARTRGTARVREDDGRRTRHQHRRAELLDAAVEYAVENGLAELSLRLLASGLGVSHKTLLYHFGTKEDLFTEIVREWQLQEQRTILERAERDQSAGFMDLLRSAWADLTAAGSEAFLRFRFEVLELARHQPDRYEDFLHSTYVVWPAIIESGLRREGLSRERARPLAYLVQAALHGLQLGLLNTGDRVQADEGFLELMNTIEVVLAAEAGKRTARSDARAQRPARPPRRP